MFRIAWLLLLLLFLSSVLFSQTTPAAVLDVLTLDEAVNLALRNNRTVHISALEVEKLGQNISAFRTHRLPVIQIAVMGSSPLTPLNFEFQKGAFGTFPGIGPIPAENKDITTPRQVTGFMMNSVAQPLSQLYKINLGLKSLEFSRDIGREDLRVKQHEIRDQVTRLYYDLAQTQTALDASLQTIQFYTELDRVTDQFLLQQAVLKADSIDVKMRLAKEQLEAVKLRNALETHQEQMNQLMGRDIRQRFRVNATRAPDAAELDLTVAQSRAFEQRPELR